MRLIDVNTLQLKEFHDKTPPYAVLSHTWDGEEITFQEYLLATGPDAKSHSHIRRKPGFSKIIGACNRAKADKLGYLWCDTNCINKSSSAELSEAINSMYAWYRDSVVCYAYLADVCGNLNSFTKSRWFTRGWTLQELLAPDKVIFFDGNWGVLGDRKGLADIICNVTRIHIGALHDRNTVPQYSIAQRMSWAAERRTTRQEDIAYCLLGIFNINMPLLYGEGQRGFLRFQQEITKVSDDQSLFAWIPDDTCIGLRSGILASSPHLFRNCGSIVRDMDLARRPYSFTNIGICMKLPVIPTSLNGVTIAGLNCAHELRKYPSKHPYKPHNSASVHATESSRRVQVWIWLWSLQHEIYERAHFPTSSVSLEYSYPISIRWVVKELFIVTSLDPEPRRQDSSSPRRALGLSEAGFLITIGSGVIDSRHRLYERVFSIGNFSIICLQGKAHSKTSHVLISSGSFSTLCSIAWDDRGRPQLWQELTFNDPRQEAYRRMSDTREWQTMFGEGSQHCHIRGKKVDSPAYLVYVHECVKKLHGTVYKGDQKDGQQTILPFVSMGKDILSDTHGRAEIGVDIVFQEVPTAINDVEMSRILRC